VPGLLGDSPFREGAVSGFLLILFSELGDKTFFIAVLLALKEARGIVFAGTFGALAIMTVISVRKCCLLLHSAAYVYGNLLSALCPATAATSSAYMST